MLAPQTFAALTVAERISALEDEILSRWPRVTVEPRPGAGVVHLRSNGVHYVVTLAFSSFRRGNIVISRHDSQGTGQQILTVEGCAQHAANEVAEALEEHLGARQDIL